MASPTKRQATALTSEDNSEISSTAVPAKQPRVPIDIAIVDETDIDLGSRNFGKHVSKDDDEFAPGAIFAAALASSKTDTGSDDTAQKEPTALTVTRETVKGCLDGASTVPKPQPGVIRVPAQQLQQLEQQQKEQQQLQQQRILVSHRQRGNPVLRSIRSVPWEFAESADPADFILGRTACCLFLSVRYHCLHPDYVHQRLRLLGPREFDLRILLLLVDTQEYTDAVRELNRICLMAGSTLILAWSNDEAGRYLESFKSLEKKPADSLMERSADDWPGQLRDVLGCIRGVSRSDAACLAANFGTFEAMIGASSAELERCPGLGPKKAARLTAVFGQNFAD